MGRKDGTMPSRTTFDDIVTLANIVIMLAFCIAIGVHIANDGAVGIGIGYAVVFGGMLLFIGAVDATGIWLERHQCQ